MRKYYFLFIAWNFPFFKGLRAKTLSILFLFISIFSFQQVYAQPSTQWEFSRIINFSSVTPLADYQVKIELNGAAQHMHMKSNGGDLRFYVGATECNYWIERFNPTGLSVIWVKIPVSGTPGLTMYYGNPAANTTSNGENTFDFFDGFEGDLDNSKWASGNITKGPLDVTVNNNGFLSNRNPFLPVNPNTSFYLETKHKESAYHRIRYYTTTSTGTNGDNGTFRRPTADYGYYQQTLGLSQGSVYWGGGIDQAPILNAGTNYITQWQINDGSTYNWKTINYDSNSDVVTKSTTIVDKLRYITIAVTENASTSSSVDWIRVRKWDGMSADITTTVLNENSHYPLPLITSVNKVKFCEGDIIMIDGEGFNSKFLSLNGNVTIGGISLINPVSNLDGTQITATIGSGSTGKIKIITVHGVFSTATDYNVYLKPFASAGPAMGAICQDKTTPSLAGTVSGGTIGGAWSVDVAGGTFNPSATDLNATWTPPSGFIGTATFTLTPQLLEGSVCTTITPVSKTVVINYLPQGEITWPSLTACEKTRIVFTAPVGFQTYSFLLNSNIWNTSSNNKDSLPVNAKTGDIVTIIATTSEGCSRTFISDPLTMNTTPVGTLYLSESTGNFPNDSIICQGDEISFSFSNPVYDSYKYTLLSNGSLLSGESYFSANGFMNGDRVKLEVGNGGCTKEFLSGIIKVNNLPVASLSPNVTAICLEQSVNFSAGGSGGSGSYTYAFFINGEIPPIQVGNSSFFSPDFLQNEDQISVIVTDANNCSGTSDQIPITVFPLPNKPVITSAGPLAFCEGTTPATLTSSSAESYQWYKNGTIISGATNQSYTTDNPLNGAGIYTVVVTNANGCISVVSDGVIVTVNPSAIPPTISESGLEICVGESRSVKLSSSSASSYQWYFSTTESGTFVPITGQTNQEIILTDVVHTGYYSVGITNMNSCAGASLSNPKNVVINALPTTPVITINPNDQTICAGETATLSVPEVTGLSYQWFKNGVAIIGAKNQTFTTVNTLDAAGDYSVQATNTNSCVSDFSSIIKVKVDTLPIPSIDGPATICLGTEGNIYTTEPGKNNYSWEISPGGNITSGQTSNQVTVSWDNSPGVKTLNVIYTEPGTGCQSNTQAIFSNSPPVLPKIKGPVQVCTNSGIVEYKTEHGQQDYDWTISAGGTIITNNDSIVTIHWTGTGSQSIMVNYTNEDNCNAPSPTIYPVTVTPLPVAGFSYSGTPYCKNGSNPSPLMMAGAKKGIFTAPGGLSIDANSGVVNLSSSTPGTYTVTNTISSAGGCGIVSYEAQITITPLPAANISYSGSPFCTSDGTVKNVSLSGTSGAYLNGIFNAASGLNIDAVSGRIDPSASTKGSYIVSYTIPATDGCPVVVVNTATPVVITELPTIILSYTSNVYCISDNIVKSPSLQGSTGSVSGGNYTASPAGLNIDAITGRFTPSGSLAGTYTITYTSPASGGCGEVSKETIITITEVPSGLIAYPSSPLCKNETGVMVVMEGNAGFTNGIFSSTPAGLSIHPASGTINPSLSTEGNYTVKYSIPSSGGCAGVSVTTTVFITEAPTVNAGAHLVTCADGLPLNVTGGASAAFYNTIEWTTSGDGTFSDPSSYTNNQYTPGVNDKLNGTVTLTMTAKGKDNCASVSDTKVIKINALPAPVVIVPPNPEFCEGTIQPLTSVKNAITNGNPVFSSGAINMAIPDNNFTGIKSKITVSGIPSNAIINNVSVKFNIDHPSGKELVGNLRSPANKEINLFYMVGSGSNFTNTVISSSATNPIQTFGSSPFSGTFSPQATLGAMGAAFNTSFSQLYTTAASLNGDWYLKLSDMVLLTGNTGTLKDWSITINYSVPVEAVPVIWSPLTDLYIDVNAETPYSGQPLATVYTKVSQFGTTTYTATNVPDGGTGCSNSSTVDVIVRESPVVQIATDYCSDPGRVILTASATGGAPFTYKWNTGGSGESVHIDEARDYYVSATNNKGCVGTAVMAIAKELVINGDFEQGYMPGSFVTDYTYVAPPGNQNSLVSEGRFAIDSNANNYHNNFYGKDHSTPEQKGKFLIVNGYPGSSNKVIWEQTVAVEPNTRYYYSAWAMNLNNVDPFARLQFSVNGEQMGSIAELKNAPRPQNTNEVNVNNWVRFYYGLSDGTDQSWYSGSATTATIRIINLEPALGGNDFGLDDISFATLSPFIRGPLADGSEKQLEICSGTPINPIIYQMGSGVENPSITGLPPGWEPTYDGLNYIISGTPVNNTNAPIRYDYILTIKGCNPVDQPKIMEGTLIVHPNSTLKMTSLPEYQDQSLCINLPMNAITFNASGQLSSIKYSGLPVGTNLYHNTGNGQVIISGTPTLAGEYNYQVRTEGGICSQDTIKGVIKISPESVAGTVSSPTVCVGESGTITLNETNQIGEVVTWQISNDGSTFTDIPNSANTTSQIFTNVNQSAFYRVKVKNEFCPQTAVSLPGKIRISNLWEGGVDTIWSKPPNWSAGNMPNNACANTITIPKVPVNKHNPWINAIVGNAQVTNLTILPGGHLTIKEGNLQIKGTIINNGIIDAMKGGVEYNGTTAQSISSGIFLNNAIGDLKVNNSDKGVTLNTHVDIYRSLTFGPGSQKLITNDQLTLKSTKEETAWLGDMTGKTITGTATVERYINTGSSATGGHRKSWQLLATPTKGQTIKDSWQEGAVSTGTTPIKNPNPGYGTLLTTGYNSVPANGFDLYTAPGPSIKTFNSSTGDYDKGPTSTDLPIYNPNGYMILVRGDRTVFTSNGPETPTILRTKGTFITGNQTISIPANSFASIGNPYASAIEIDKIVKSPGMTEFIAVWDPLLGGNYGLGGFVTLTKSGGNYIGVPSGGYYSGVTNFIQSGQAFMVQSKPEQSGTITFTEGSKVSGSKLVSRKGNEDSRTAQLRTNLFGLNSDGSGFITDGTLHQFDPEYSNAIDGLDARKMTNTSENLSIHTNGSRIVIERRQPLNETDTLFFNLTGVRVQQYRFEFTAQNMQDGNLQGFIEDVYLGTKTILNLEGITKYDFEIENKPGSYESDRFRIVFKSALGPLPVTFVGINANQVKEDILVTWNVENELNVLGYDIEKSTDGISFTKMIHLPAINNKSYNWLDKDVQPGNHYYRVKAVNEDGKTELSSIAKVYIQMEPSKIAVYPNPITNGVLKIHLINQASGKYKIRLLNPVGQTIVNKIVTHSQGNSIHSIDWDYKMARGVYQIEITKPDGGVNLMKVVY